MEEANNTTPIEANNQEIKKHVNPSQDASNLTTAANNGTVVIGEISCSSAMSSPLAATGDNLKQQKSVSMSDATIVSTTVELSSSSPMSIQSNAIKSKKCCKCQCNNHTDVSTTQDKQEKQQQSSITKITLKQFTEQLMEHICIVCNDVYYEPQLLACTHTFCAYCIFKWLSKSTSCPMCRREVKPGDIVPDRSAESAIKEVYKKMKPKYKIERRAHELRRQDQLESLLHEREVSNSREAADESSDNNREFVLNPLDQLHEFDFEEFYQDLDNLEYGDRLFSSEESEDWSSWDISSTHNPTIVIRNQDRRHGRRQTNSANVTVRTDRNGNVVITTNNRTESPEDQHLRAHLYHREQQRRSRGPGPFDFFFPWSTRNPLQ